MQRYLTRAVVMLLVGLGLGTWSGAQAPATRPEDAADAAHRGMVLIPAGTFTMGTDDRRSSRNERPAHKVKLDSFWIDVAPVTNGQFRAFVEATKYLTTAERPVDWEELKKQVPAGTPKPPDEVLKPGSLVFTPPPAGAMVDVRDMNLGWAWTTGADWRHPEGPASSIVGKDNYPVVQVSWDDAQAYAKWAGKRLPTEAGWEYAARGGLDGKRFVWGDEFMPGGKYMANTYTGKFPEKDTAEDGYAGTSPVTAFPANGYGLRDMAGNVWQWTADLYREDVHALAVAGGPNVGVNPKGPTETSDSTRDMPSSPERVVKGGSFLCNASYCEGYRPSARRGTPPDTGTSHTGFRCAASEK